MSFTDWRTPRALFDPLYQVTNFAVDAAADESNHLLPVWYGPGGVAEDALAVDRWLSPAWCNPPYGRDIERWLAKFLEQSRLGVDIVALLPARVETRWWYDYVVGHADIMFLTGRVPFERPDREKPSQPDHASTLIIYGPGVKGQAGWLDWRARADAAKAA